MKAITLRLQDHEFVKIKHEADSKDLSLNEYIRDVVINKTSSAEALEKMEGARYEITEALMGFRQEVGRLSNDLIKTMRDANEVMAEDMERKMAVEVDELRGLFLELLKKSSAQTKPNSGFVGPMKTPTSSPY